MPKVVLNSGVRIHYQQIGEGPDLVMIHGLTGNLAVWHLNIIPAISHSYRTLTYDLRGHGYSDMTPTGYSGDADGRGPAGAARRARDRAAAARRAQLRRRHRPLLRAQPSGSGQRASSRSRPRFRRSCTPATATSGRAGITGPTCSSGPASTVPPEHRSDAVYLLRASLDVPKKWGPLAGLPRNPKPFLRLIEETTVAAEYEEVGSLTLDRIADIQTPVLLMYADGAAFLGTHEYLAAHLPNAESIILPSTEWGHFGPLEQPEVVAEPPRRVPGTARADRRGRR